MSKEASFGKTLLISLVAAIGGFLFGFDSGVINGTVDALQKAFNSDSIGAGFNVASMLLGCAVGAFFAGTLADRFGRKRIMMFAAIAFILSAWGSGVASASTEFVIYRVIGGLAVGAASVLAPAYISEIAPAKIRGSLSSLQQLMIVLGLFVAFFSNYLIAKSAGGASEVFWGGFQAWQWMFWIEIIPASIFLVSLFLIPESPRYLVAAGKTDQAIKVLSHLTHPDDAPQKLKEIQNSLDKNHRPSLSDLFGKGGKLHAIVWVGLGLAALQQFTGINVVFYYGSVLWQSAGFTEEHALLINVITGAINIGFTLVAMSLVDRIGRRPLLLAGSLGMAVTLGTLAVVFGTAASTDDGTLALSKQAGIVALIAANMYVMCFAFSWGPIMWVMLGEMFPNQYRGSALAICGISQWVSNFLITMSFPIMLSAVGLGISYGVYAAFGVIAFIFVKRFVAETKGMTLEQMG